MDSSLSPIVANIFMECFETKALETAPHPPGLWKIFVDDTFIIIERRYKEEFSQHINSIDKNIQFTAENTREDRPMPFVDTLVIPQNDGSLLITVYRKPTHANQYLQWDSHHAISAKYSVIRDTVSQGQGCMLYKRTNRRRTQTYSESPNIMQVSRIGCKQDEDEDQGSCKTQK